MKIRVAVGLSGGVDSAVSAYLLKEKGFDVSCIYLNCYDGDTPGCRGDNDRKDALAVAMRLDLPFQVLDFRKEYQAAVIDYFKKEYLLGRTPNPDVVCNRDIKFGLFMDWSIKAGFDYVATGHYAGGPDFSSGKIVGTPAPANSRSMSRASNEGKANAKTWLGATPLLRIPKDLRKDQTYFLWAVPKEKFKRVLFPLGNLLKTEVREIALKIGLPVAKKKDSTGICFIGEVRVEDFLKRLGVKEKRGEVAMRTTIDNSEIEDSNRSTLDPLSSTTIFHHPSSIVHYKVVGSHRGVWFYTIGQRHGFEITNWPPVTSSLRGASRRATWQSSEAIRDKPVFYVIEKDIKKNRLIVGFGAETYRKQFTVSQVNWLAELPITNYQLPIAVRIRHGGELIPCSINAQRSTLNAQRTTYIVRLRFAQRGIAPGQSAVFYLPRRSGAKAGSKNEIVLGGGVIQ